MSGLVSLTLPWPATSPGASPIGALYSQNYFAARDVGSSSFALTLVEKKEVITFSHQGGSPIAAWRLFDNLIFVIHEDGSLQIVNPVTLQAVILETEKSDFFLPDDAPSQMAVSDRWIVVCIKRGVAYWERDSKDKMTLLSSFPRCILIKGSSNALDSVKIEGDTFFYAMQSTWKLLNLKDEKRIDTFDWTESVGHYFKFEKLDRVIVGTKSDTMVLYNLEEKTRNEIRTERFITALSFDQTFLITGDAEFVCSGNVQLRNPVTGDVLFGLKYVEDDAEAEKDLTLNADEDERSFMGEDSKKSKKKKKKDKESERSKIHISLTSRINLVKRIGRYVVAAHEDSYLSLWDVNKSTKRPIQTVSTSGPVRFFTVTDDGAIEAGTLFDPKKVGKAVKASVKELATSSMTSQQSMSLKDDGQSAPSGLRRSQSAAKKASEVSSKTDSADDEKPGDGGDGTAKKKFTFNLKNDDAPARRVSSSSGLKSSRSQSASTDGSPASLRRNSSVKSENAALMVELIRWKPKYLVTGAKPLPPTLPLAVSQVKAPSLQDALQSFSTSADWWEFELKRAPFTVLIFFRGLWCKSCGTFLPHWNRILKPIENLGGRVIGITSDTLANTKEFKKIRNIDFELLSDPTCELANYYHVPLSAKPPWGQTATDIGGGPAPFPYGMTESSVFIVSKDRKFYFKWTLRPSIKNSFGGLGRPDPVDVWRFVGHKIEKGSAPANLSIKVGDPISKMGWRKHKIEDLPGGRVVFVEDKVDKTEKAGTDVAGDDDEKEEESPESKSDEDGDDEESS